MEEPTPDSIQLAARVSVHQHHVGVRLRPVEELHQCEHVVPVGHRVVDVGVLEAQHGDREARLSWTGSTSTAKTVSVRRTRRGDCRSQCDRRGGRFVHMQHGERLQSLLFHGRSDGCKRAFKFGEYPRRFSGGDMQCGEKM